MPRQKDGVVPAAMPLPAGWEEAKCEDGKPYFIDHNKRKTSWIDPREKLIRPKTFADCIGHELPLGWEECCDAVISTYYVDHNREVNQLEDPRQQWHEAQERMLREYLKNAEMDLEAQHGLIDVKQRRLHLAQEKLEYLTTELEKTNDEHENTFSTEMEEIVELNDEDTTDSSESALKYNPDELKEDIANARERVDNLKREMEEVSDNVRQQQEGVTKLIGHEHFENGVKNGVNGVHKVEVNRDKVNELKEARERLLLGEQQKIQILQELLRQKDECQVSDLSSYRDQINGSTTSLNSCGSVCSNRSNPSSQYMGSNENIGGVGMGKRQLRKDYQLALQKVKELHDALEFVDYQLEANHSGHEQHRYMLFNEKQILLTELDRFAIYIRTEEERAQLEYEKELLIQDLLAMKEMSSKVIEDRMQLQNDQDYLKQQLMEKNRQTNLLELKLKSLSASTLSVSSTSSRGSMSTGSRGSLSASSRGSLNSLCHHGEAGGNEHYSSFCHLPSNNCPPIYESHILATKAETTEGLCTTTTSDHQSPYVSFTRYPRETIPAVSPTMSPLTADLPPPHKIAEIPVCGNAGMFHVDNGNGAHGFPRDVNKCDDGSYRSYASFPLTTYQCTMGSSNDISSNHFVDHVVHNAISNESVAADSGVFEPFNELRKSSVTRQDSGHSSGVYCSEYNIETAQIRIGLEYRCSVGKLALTIEKGRNIKALCFQPLKHIYVSGNLLPPSPTGDQNFHIRTRISINTDRPCFNEQFLFTIDRNKLVTKTLQLDLFAMLIENNLEECLGCSQISLAEFDSNQEIGLKWYNLLSSFTNTRHQPSLNRSDSGSSLEAVQQRFNMLPGLVANSEEGLNNSNYENRLRSNSYNRDQICEGRERANSNEDRCSINSSQSNLATNSLCGSTERMHRYTPPRVSSCMRPHLRSRSDEREEQAGDANVARSASDCTGCRKAPLRAPFIRMGVCRRSIRQSRLAELSSRKSVPSLIPPLQPKHEPPRHIVKEQNEQYKNIRRRSSATPLDSEMQIQAALSNQETEISRLKEIKQLMEEHKMGGNENISQWLVENGDNFHALLDEAKKEVSSHLSGLASLSSTESLNRKFVNLTPKTNSKQVTVVTNDTNVVTPSNSEIHWV